MLLLLLLLLCHSHIDPAHLDVPHGVDHVVPDVAIVGCRVVFLLNKIEAAEMVQELNLGGCVWQLYVGSVKTRWHS
jgi:hypothetical protein